MAVRIKLATTNEERFKVFRFRYSVYIEEMRRQQKYANHHSKIVEEPLDRKGHVLIATENGRVVGTARFNVGVDDTFGYYDDLYNLKAFGAFYPSSVSITTKLMVAADYRRSLLPLKLAIGCYVHGLERGAVFDVIDCNAPLVDFFRRLGYRQVFPDINHPEYGNVIPMVLALYDKSHLRAIRSPFARFAEKLEDIRESCAHMKSLLLAHPGRKSAISHGVELWQTA